MKQKSVFFLVKTGKCLIDFDVIFPIQSSEFIKSSNFTSNLKKKMLKKHKIFYFSPKNDFYGLSFRKIN